MYPYELSKRLRYKSLSLGKELYKYKTSQSMYNELISYTLMR